MYLLRDIEKEFGMTKFHIQRLAKIRYGDSHDQYYTQEEINELLRIRAEMKGGKKLSWKEVKAKYAQQETKSKPATPPVKIDKEFLQKRTQPLQKAISDNNSLMISTMVAKDMMDKIKHIPYMAASAIASVFEADPDPMENSRQDVIDFLLESPDPDYSEIEEAMKQIHQLPFETGDVATGGEYKNLMDAENQEE